MLMSVQACLRRRGDHSLICCYCWKIYLGWLICIYDVVRTEWWVVLHRKAMISPVVKRLHKPIVPNVSDRSKNLSTVAFSMRFSIPSATEVCFAHRTFRQSKCFTFRLPPSFEGWLGRERISLFYWNLSYVLVKRRGTHECVPYASRFSKC